MADIESNIRIDVDTSSALESLKNLQRQISAFQKQMQASSAANASAAKDLQRSLIGDINSTGKFAARMESIKSSTESFTTSLEKNKLSMGEYFKYSLSQTKSFGKNFATEFATIEKVARERVKTLQTQYISLGRDATGSLNAISVRPLELDLKNLATQQAINAQKQQIFNQLLKQGSTNLLNFGKNTQWAGRQLMVGFTIPLSIFGSTAAKAFMELEEQVIKFKRVYGDLMTPSAETDEMIQQIKDLGMEYTKYGVAVKDTMNLAADAAAMGKQGADLTAQVTAATRLSVLGNVSQQDALETSISITNAFGVATEQLAGKIDFLNAVENQTVTSIEDLTTAIPKAGPVVQQLGGDVEDLAFFLTAMKEGGINASEGANALKSGLASLINPTGRASDMLRAYGINIKEIVSKNAGNVSGIVVDFAKALDQLNPTDRARAIEQLFGKFQFSRISTLFQNVIAEGSQASKVLELMGATSAELAALSSKELKTVEESVTYKFKAAIEEFKAQLAPVGEEFMKLVTPLIQFGSKVLEVFNNMGDHAKGFITGTIAVLGGLAPVALMTFGLVANGVANLVKGFQFLRNAFAGTLSSEQVLGEQTSYLTEEQLKASAVAASLEQVHSRLPQIFTAEAGAIDMLTAAYERADVASGRFANRPIPTSIGKGKTQKFATGGFVSGSGNGDVIPAMLTPGEFVVKKDVAQKVMPFLEALNSGKIPGFNGGGEVTKSASQARGYLSDAGSKKLDEALRAAESVSVATVDSLKKAIEKLGNLTTGNLTKLLDRPEFQLLSSLTAAKGGRSTGSQGMVKAHGGLPVEVLAKDLVDILSEKQMASLSGATKINAMNNLTFGMPAAFNRGQMSGSEAAGFVRGNHSDFMSQIVGQSGIDPNDPAVVKFAQNVASQLEMAGSQAIGDSQFEEIIKKALAEEIDSTAKQVSQEAKAAFDEARKISTIQYTKTAADGSTVTNRINIPKAGRGQSIGDMQTIGAGTKPYRSVNLPSGAHSRADEFTKTVIQQRMGSFDNAVVDGVKVSTQQRSPSKKAFEAGENIGLGAIQGIESTIPEATQAGRRRRGGASSGGPVTVGSGSLNFTKDPKSGNVVASEKFLAMEQTRAAARQKLLGMEVAKATTRIKSFSNTAMAVSGAIGTLAMTASAFGIELGGFGDAVFQATNTIFLLTAATKALIASQTAQRVMGGALDAASLISGGKGAGLKGIANFFKGLPKGDGSAVKNIFSNLGNVAKGATLGLGKFGPAILKAATIGLKFVPVVGALFTAFQAGLAIYNNVKDNIEGLGDASFLSAEKMQKAGELLNFEVKAANFKGSFAAGGTEASSSKQQTDIETLRANEDFKSTDTGFGKEINAIKGATVAEAELALKSLSIQMAASGAPKEAVDTMVKAIAQEAGRTDLNLSFTNIDFSTKEGIAEITKVATDAATQFSTAFTSNYDPGAWFGIQNQEMSRASEAAGASFASLFTGLKAGFESGVISAEEFNTQITGLQTQLSTLDPAGLSMIMPTIIKNLDIESEMDGITRAQDQIVLVSAAAAGIKFPTEDLEKFKNASKDDATAEDLRIANELQEAYRVKIEETTAAREADTAAATEAALLNEQYATAIVGLEDQRDNLLDQKFAYDGLIASGYSAAAAIEAVGNANFVSAYAAAANSEEQAKVLAIWEEIKGLEKSSPIKTGGGGEKSAIEKAIEQLKDQVKQIRESSIAYGRLTKAGLTASDAFSLAKDPILAAAIATTKVGTAAWKKLVKLIKEANAAAKTSDLLGLIKEMKIDNSLTKSFADIAPLLSRIGLTGEQIREILGNPTLAEKFVSDLKDGAVNSKIVYDYINALKGGIDVEIKFNGATPEGLQDQFSEIYDRAMEGFDVEERTVDAKYASKISLAEKAVDSAQKAVDAAQKEIDGLQTSVDKKQKEIELTIDRPIENLNKQIESIQREIETKYDRPLQSLQDEAQVLSNDLAIIDHQTDAINKRYDEQQKALEKISQVNQDIRDQDKSRLSIADALSKGNAAEAVRAMQAAQQEQAAKAKERAQAALDAARQNEIGKLTSSTGMTREQIAERQYQISQASYTLESQKLELQKKIVTVEDSIYALEQKRQPLLDSIRSLEDQMYAIQVSKLEPAQKDLDTKQAALDLLNEQKDAEIEAIDLKRQAWEAAQLAVDKARVESKGYITDLETALGVVRQIQAAWAAVGTSTLADVTGKTTNDTSMPKSSVANSNNNKNLGSKVAPEKPTADAGVGYTWKLNTSTNKWEKAEVKKQISPVPGYELVWDTNKDVWVNQKKIPSTSLLGAYQKNWAEYSALKEEEDRFNSNWFFAMLQGADGVRRDTWRDKRMTELSGLMKPFENAYGQTWRSSMPVDAAWVQGKASGGMIVPNRFARGGFAMGTDTVPAMLTPGEFVVKRSAVQSFGTDRLKAINSGTYEGESVYNYSVNVNVQSGADANKIAQEVMTQIKRIDSQRIRGNRQ